MLGKNSLPWIIALVVLFAFLQQAMGQTLAGQTPAQVAEVLVKAYGQKLTSNTYTQAIAVQGKLLLGARLQRAEWIAQAQGLAGPYMTGERPVTIQSHPDVAGHLLFAELARQAGPESRAAYRALVIKAADSLFDKTDQKPIRLPAPGVMSDAVFMCGPILCEAGSLTDDPRYFDAAIRYIQKVREQCVRTDGLYRHSDLCDAAWGRGNGFPALGVAWCLSQIPSQHAGRETLVRAFEEHLSVLLKHQDESGSWHQVIDHPESYLEITCTAMIGCALERAIQQHWLAGPAYRTAADRAWNYVTANLRQNGEVQGACESTGKQKSLSDYLQRKAIVGKDDRSGSMLLLFCHERAGL
jgi:unsaturated rhamnogalacturonyl hydrolase